MRTTAINLIIGITILSLLYVLPITLFTAQNFGLKNEFNNWMVHFGKSYIHNQQQSYRFSIYKQNKQRVQAHNQLAKQGKSKYFMGLNQFADFTQLQFKHSYGKLKGSSTRLIGGNTTECKGGIADSPDPPEVVSWLATAVDKAVRVQGKCAANWAFSAVAAIEGLNMIQRQPETLIKLSDQQTIDCSGDYGNEGCGGGFMQQAFWYMIDHGVAVEDLYPYTGLPQRCYYTQAIKYVRPTKCAKVPTQIYDKLISAVIQQPVSVSLASQKFMLYERGIFDGDCTLDLDRGMLLVGYGVEEEQKYWVLKNFLGVAWGEKGYMRLLREPKNGPGLCGIQLAASVPQVIE